MTDRTFRIERRGALAMALMVFTSFAGPAHAIDDSVLTEVNAFGLINDAQFEHLKSRREVVIIAIKDGKVDQREVHVTPNTVVVFDNQDEEEKHFIYVTPDPNNDLLANVLTEMIEPGGRWAATFTTGEYPFHCERHRAHEEEKGRIYSSLGSGKGPPMGETAPNPGPGQ